MKLLKLLTVIAFVLMLLLNIGCGQKEEAPPDPAEAGDVVEEVADSLKGEVDAAADSLKGAAEEAVEETSGH